MMYLCQRGRRSLREEEFLTVEEIATRLKVNPVTVRRWLRSRRLRGVMLGGTKLGYRVPAGEVERFLKEPEKAI